MHDTTKSFDAGAARDDSQSLQSPPVHPGSGHRLTLLRSARALHLAERHATSCRRLPRGDAICSNTATPRAAATRRPAAQSSSNDIVARTCHMGQTYAQSPAPVPIMVINPVDPQRAQSPPQKPPPRHLKQHRGREGTPSSSDNGDSDTDTECAACTVKYANTCTSCPVCKALHPDFTECSSCTTHYDKTQAACPTCDQPHPDVINNAQGTPPTTPPLSTRTRSGERRPAKAAPKPAPPPPAAPPTAETWCTHGRKKCSGSAYSMVKTYINNVRAVERGFATNDFDKFMHTVLNYHFSWAEFADKWNTILQRHNLSHSPPLKRHFAPCARRALMKAIINIANNEFNANRRHGNSSSNASYRNELGPPRPRASSPSPPAAAQPAPAPTPSATIPHPVAAAVPVAAPTPRPAIPARPTPPRPADPASYCAHRGRCDTAAPRHDINKPLARHRGRAATLYPKMEDTVVWSDVASAWATAFKDTPYQDINRYVPAPAMCGRKIVHDDLMQRAQAHAAAIAAEDATDDQPPQPRRRKRQPVSDDSDASAGAARPPPKHTRKTSLASAVPPPKAKKSKKVRQQRPPSPRAARAPSPTSSPAQQSSRPSSASSASPAEKPRGRQPRSASPTSPSVGPMDTTDVQATPPRTPSKPPSQATTPARNQNLITKYLRSPAATTTPPAASTGGNPPTPPPMTDASNTASLSPPSFTAASATTATSPSAAPPSPPPLLPTITSFTASTATSAASPPSRLPPAAATVTDPSPVPAPPPVVHGPWLPPNCLQLRRGSCTFGNPCRNVHLDDQPHGTYTTGAQQHALVPSSHARPLQFLPTPSAQPPTTPADPVAARNAMLTFTTALLTAVTMAADVSAFLRSTPHDNIPSSARAMLDASILSLSTELDTVRRELYTPAPPLPTTNDVLNVTPIIVDTTNPLRCQCTDGAADHRCTNVARVVIHLRPHPGAASPPLVRCFDCMVLSMTMQCPCCTYVHASPATRAVMAVLHAKWSPQTHMRHTVMLNDAPISALCDTAAPGCVRCADTLTPDERRRLTPYTGPRLVGANLADLTILGTVITTVTIQGITFEIPFVVCQPLAVTFVLGWDFMRRHVCHIDPQFDEWQVVSWCPPDLDSYHPLRDLTNTADHHPCSPLPPLSPLSSASTTPCRAHDQHDPAVSIHQHGPCFSDLATVMYHYLPPFTRDLSHGARILVWANIFDHEHLPLMVIHTDNGTPLREVKLECSEDIAPSSESALFSLEVPMQCPLCKTWAQAFDVCTSCAHRLGITFGGLPSTPTREASTLDNLTCHYPFNRNQELTPAPRLVADHVREYFNRYDNMIHSAATFLTGGPTFDVDEFHNVAYVIVENIASWSDEPAHDIIEARMYTMAAIAQRMQPFTVPDGELRRAFERYYGPNYRPPTHSARHYALRDLHRRRGVPVYFNDQIFYMRTREDVKTCIDLDLIPAAVAGDPLLVPADRVSSKFGYADVALMRRTLPTFASAVRKNVHSARNLGLLTSFELPWDDVPDVPNSGEHQARPAPSPSAAVKRDPYMTRGRTARINAAAAARFNATAAARESNRPRTRRHTSQTTTTPSRSTTAGPPRGSPTSRPASTPIVDTVHGDFVGAGERVVPGGPAQANQWF